ncbi:MAG TPA: low affinity iron permease family protein [Pseudomonadota bacterium]|nr:low affinity iron permease family protein [Pseudomonadota bacterium]
MNELFRKYAARVAELVGTSWAFLVAVTAIAVWAASGPLFHFSDTWQLVINTSTTIITFLMVFLIQNTQNRDAKAIHLKLDELIRAMKGARNNMIDLEHLSDQELEELHRQFVHVAQTTEPSHAHAAGSSGLKAEPPRRAAKKAAHAVANELKKRGAPPPAGHQADQEPDRAPGSQDDKLDSLLQGG